MKNLKYMGEYICIENLICNHTHIAFSFIGEKLASIGKKYNINFIGSFTDINTINDKKYMGSIYAIEECTNDEHNKKQYITIKELMTHFELVSEHRKNKIKDFI